MLNLGIHVGWALNRVIWNFPRC